MRNDSSNIQALLEPVVESMGYELVGIEYQGRGHHGLLRLYVDKPGGIVMEDCEKVSYQVSGVLDVEDPIMGRYTLEVSSPGLDRPLFKPAHYERFVGERISLRLAAPLNGRRKFSGLLKAFENDEVVLLLDEGDEIRVAYQEIDGARLVPEF